MVDMSEGDARRHHPFGKWPNRLVLAGTSLSIIQSLVVALGAFAAPATDGFELEGPPLLLYLLFAVGLPTAVGWTAWRALRSWWRRSVKVVNRLLVAGLVAMPSTVLLSVPLGGDVLTPIGYLPAAGLMIVGGLLARERVEIARQQRRGGLSDT